MSFKLDRKFLKSSYHITDLKLCAIRLNNNSKFPWLILIPKRNKINDMSDLKSKDQILLMKEIVYVSKIMKKLFKTSKLDRKSTRLNSSHSQQSRMPSSA